MSNRVTTGAHRMIPSITPPSVPVDRCQRCGRSSTDVTPCECAPTDEDPADTGTLPWHRDATGKDRLR